MIRYGSETYNNPEKNFETKLINHGNGNYNNPDKHRDTCLERYGVDHHNKCKSISSKISETRIREHTHEKALLTILDKYGSLENYYSACSEKAYNTRITNGTLSNYKSSLETELESKLVSRFGVGDVVYNYRSGDYPYKADFYVRSIDTYIELNGFFTHGDHPFDDSSEEDLLSKLLLEESSDQWDKQILYVWTDLDVRKMNCGIQNDLNIVFIYPTVKGEDIVYTHLK